MRSPAKLAGTLIAVLLLLGAAPGALAESERAEPGNFYQQSFGNLQNDLRNALDSGKKGVLIYWHQSQCPFCEKMEREVFTQPIVHEFFHKYFDVYKVNIKGNKQFTDLDGDRVSQVKLAVQNRARATPTLVIFGKGGEELVRFVTNPNVREMLALGKYVVDGAHQNGTDFFKYKNGEAQPGIKEEIRQDYL
jgi:thioredoxin-related protein